MEDDDLFMAYPNLGINSDDHPTAVSLMAEQTARMELMVEELGRGPRDMHGLIELFTRTYMEGMGATARSLAAIEALARGTEPPSSG